MISNTVLALHKRTPSENWDEDFDFHAETDNQHIDLQSHNRKSNDGIHRSSLNFTRQHISPEVPDQPGFHSWPEAGPSKASISPPQPTGRSTSNQFDRKHVRVVSAQSVSLENWDDDFEDMRDSPKRISPQKSYSRRFSPTEEENWDEDLHLSIGNSPVTRLIRHTGQLDSSDDDDDSSLHGLELGFSDREEDRTVTGRSRPANSDGISLPPIPPLPNLSSLIIPDTKANAPTPFPRSPTLSTFSIPYSGRESTTYGSTAHLTLHQTRSSSRLSKLPPSPPVHKERERRRLRKKSRPSYLDGNIVELDDHPDAVLQAPLKPPPSTSSRPLSTTLLENSRPSTPEKVPINQLPSPISNVILQSRTSPSAVASAETGSPLANKTPLLSRIGSVKRWAGASGLRRKRASTGPAELPPASSTQASVTNITTPPSSPPQGRRVSHFFRAGSLASENLEAENPSRKTGKEKYTDSSKMWKRTVNLGSGHSSLNDHHGTTALVIEGQPIKSVPMEQDAVLLSPEVVSSDRRSTMLEMTPRRPHSQRSAIQPAFPRFVSGPNIPNAEKENSTLSANMRSSSTYTARSNYFNEQSSSSARASSSGDLLKSNEGDASRMGHSPHKMGTMKEYPEITLNEPSISFEATSSAVLSKNLTIPDTGHRMAIGDSGTEKEIFSENVNEIRTTTTLPKPPVVHATSLPTDLSDFERNVSNSNGAYFKSINTTPSKSHMVPPKLLASPQSASLGRATMTPPNGTHTSSNAFRRSSLGDLKIPARISQAQDALKKDLNRVREFAFHVEQMKTLRDNHNDLLSRIWKLVEGSTIDVSHTVSSGIFSIPLHIPRTRSRNGTRSRSNTNPSRPFSKTERQNRDALTNALTVIDSKYSVAWECAELLIDLGGSSSAGPSESVSAPLIRRPSTGKTNSKPSSELFHASRKSRERAITLAGGTSKPSDEVLGTSFSNLQRRQLDASQAGGISGPQWQNTAGRRDLSQRQINLLEFMLNRDPEKENLHVKIPELEEDIPTFSNHWQWGSAMDSTVTLPSEDSTSAYDVSPTKKRNSTKLGIVGFRDLLKSLAKAHSSGQRGEVPDSHNTSSASVVSSAGNSRQKSVANHIVLPSTETANHHAGRQNKSNVKSQSVKLLGAQASMTSVNASLAHRPSPRRPSLASLFRIGQKTKQTAETSNESKHGSGIHSIVSNTVSHLSPNSEEDNDGIYSDWDKIDSSSDLEELRETLIEIGQGLDHVATIKGKRNNHVPRDHISQKQANPQRACDPTEHSFWTSPLTSHREALDHTTRLNNDNHHFLSVKKSLSTQVTSTPTAFVDDSIRLGNLQDFKLVLTPNNIKPLLENARDVTTRLTDCVRELELLISVHT